MSTILITGGAGFIGTNLAYRLLSLGHIVYIFDNLSRPHVVRNLSWLMDVRGERLYTEIGDVRDPAALRRVVKRADHVYHLASQAAVTSSVDDPKDFDVNVGGTMQLLEAIRSSPNPPSLIFTSTNKVYGALKDIPLITERKRYVRAGGDDPGIDESQSLSFHSPYGSSKGAADQYILDYGRTFGIPTAVFRMSCIYGPHQFGTEDQGWVAHIMKRAMANHPITIYGDGHQVQDILFVEDLVDALVLAKERIGEIAGEAFNIGGGPSNSISVLEFLDLLAELDTRPLVNFARWRICDLKYYISNTTKFRTMTGWSPQIGIREGVKALYNWLADRCVRAESATRKAS